MGQEHQKTEHDGGEAGEREGGWWARRQEMLARKQQDAALERPGFMMREWGSRGMERAWNEGSQDKGKREEGRNFVPWSQIGMKGIG